MDRVKKVDLNVFFIFQHVALTLFLTALFCLGLGISVLPQFFRLQHDSAIASSQPIPSSFFGMTINHWQSVPWPTLPFGILRTWDSGVVWANINKAPGIYAWSDFDFLVELSKNHGSDVLFTFGQTPKWASAEPNAPTPYGPGLCAPPLNINYWDDFVRAIVKRARGRIKFWEVWNEPQDKNFYCGDINSIVKLQEHAYKIIKALDPQSIVLSPSPVGGHGPQWMSDFLTQGGGQFADVMAFHGYSDAHAESIITVANNFKNVFAAHGQGSKPIWDTESSWGETTHIPNSDLQAAFLAKYYLLHWSEGISSFFWYSYDNKRFGGLWDKVDGLHNAANAYLQVHKWMVGATLNAPCDTQLFTHIWTCDFSRPNGYQAIAVWHPGGSVSFSPPTKYVQYRDLEGTINKVEGTVLIGDKPILFETKSSF